MKKILLLLSFVTIHFLAHAQRFFYIEPNHMTDSAIRAELVKATQYVTKSPLSSDFIIKTDIGYTEESKELSMTIQLQDSVTLKTIYQTSEQQKLYTAGHESRVIFGTAIRYFIDRNIARMIVCARQNHEDSRMLFLKAKKDKT